jgi:opacity protein-like surface antigen
MKKIAHLLLLGASFAATAAPAFAADIIEEPPVVVEQAPPPVVVEAANGWYIRGDVDYAMLKTKGIDYDVLTGSAAFDTAKFKGSFSAGAGLGYQFSDHFRADWTLTQHFKTGFEGSTSGSCGEVDPVTGFALTGTCVSSDTAKVSVLALMANAYADLGNYHGFTPYVGAGIGGAHVNWSDLTNTATCTPSTATAQCEDQGTLGTAGAPYTYSYVHKGISDWRFAYALHAGVSYDLMANLKLDAGYSWTHVNGGDMFRFKGLANHLDDTGVMGKDRGINIHEARIGVRYLFGGGHHGGGYEPAGYTDGPVYK